MALIVRDAVPSDFNDVNLLMNQVHAIHHENRPDIYQTVDQPLSEKAFNDMLCGGAAIVLVAEDQDVIVALCMVSIKSPAKNPLLVPRKVAYMDALVVHERCRKQGIGKLIFHVMVERIKEHEVSSLGLMVWSFNQGAIGFYEAMGMRARSIALEMDLD